jgi:hypothetical protein
MRGAIRKALMACSSVLLAVSCGAATAPLTAYVEEFNRLAEDTYVPLRAAWQEYAELGDPTPADLAVVLDRDIELRSRAQDAFAGLHPPDQIDQLHGLFIGWHARLVADEQQLLVRVGAASTWSQVEESQELARYRATLDIGALACRELGSALAATESRGFSEVAWLPGDMKEAVDVALGCDVLVRSFEGARDG